MNNLELFFFTVVIYFLLWRIALDFYYCVDVDNPRSNLIFCKEAMRHLGLITLLCFPVNVNGNVFTVFGNVSSKVTKNAYSVFSPYQSAENNAASVFGSFYQKAGENAFVFVGPVVYQKGGSNAITIVGIAIKQYANDEVVNLVGITGFQKSKNLAVLGVGVSGIQIGRTVKTGLGLSGYQHGFKSADTTLAMAIHQQAGDKVRNFAIWSTLKAK